LPGIAAQQAGSALVLAYLVAAIALIPAMLSILELSTAMPRAGGVYYFLDRSLGPFFGTIGGIGTYLVLILKVAFSLIGMGVYISIFFSSIPIIPVAVVLALILGIINFAGIKKSGNFQIVLLIILLILLTIFIVSGISSSKGINFNVIKISNFHSLIATAGLVFISYAGITKVTSLSEEIHNPEKNIPLGIVLALSVSIIIYLLGTLVMVKVIPIENLAGDLSPVATAGGKLLGKTGEIILSIAALLAFISVANAGILSASRYPLAMSRDHILPQFFKKLYKNGSPFVSITLTISIIILIIFTMDVARIAKLASAFQLLVFAFVSLAVIIMRESKIESYDPGFKSPLYPWMQILGIFISFWMIYEMGIVPIAFSSGLVIIGFLWYWYYARKRVVRTGAIYHIFERLGRQRYAGLESEMRGILKEKGLRDSDPFDEIVARSNVINLPVKAEFEEVVTSASAWISQFVQNTADEIQKQFLEGTRMGATPVTHGIALPHLRLAGLQQAEMVLVRANNGVHMKFKNPLTDFEEEEQDVKAIFFLISPEKDPTQHLRILAQIAGRVEEENFAKEWEAAKDDQEIKEVLLHEDRCLSITVEHTANTANLLNKQLKEINFPEGCLVAMIRRSGETIIPTGKTVLIEGDRLTIIGDPKGMTELKKRFLSNVI
jgi:amino acid transporter/mannitol/fructose-specific phosphotransferase system IIA component (Ntr-type)